ncbi:MAG: hypothetical protein ACLGJC_11290 [Alphaproteobacteria bacterium]
MNAFEFKYSFFIDIGDVLSIWVYASSARKASVTDYQGYDISPVIPTMQKTWLRVSFQPVGGSLLLNGTRKNDMLQLKRRLCWLPVLGDRAFSLLPMLTLLLAMGIAGSGKAVATTAAEFYGVVEIGSRGIRGFAFDLDSAKRQECQADEERYTACLNLRSTQPRNVSPGQSDDIKRTVAAIAATVEDLQQFGVPSRNLYIVGSSGAAKGEMRGDCSGGWLSARCRRGHPRIGGGRRSGIARRLGI